MRAILVISALVFGGCSFALDFDGDLVDAAPEPADGGGDAALADAARDAAPDASAIGQTILCGTARCNVGAQICCQTATASTCQPRGSACTGIAMSCDGTEDCPGEVCCGILPAGPLECLPYGFGTSRCSGRAADSRIVICNERTDCQVERPICQQCLLQGKPIKYCTDILTTGCSVVP